MFYQKYRPKDFNEIIGNENNKEILERLLKKENIPQIYLFYGDYGCGKTTFARIMANKLNCGENIYEINSSNNRGIDTARQIIEQSEFKSLDGKNKCFILDEFHKSTNDMQNAMLKILEDTPKDVYFFICTTEKNKIIDTIVSRCKVIEVEKLSVRELYPYLIEISKKENNEISKNVARKIADNSKCHFRDSLQILENVLEFKNEDKQLEIAGKELEDNKEIIDLCRLLISNDSTWNEVKNILKQLQKENAETIRKVIISYMGQVLLNNANKRAALIIESLKNNIYEYPVLIMQLFSIYC